MKRLRLSLAAYRVALQQDAGHLARLTKIRAGFGSHPTNDAFQRSKAMDTRLTGKGALATGGSRGLGAATARRVSMIGWTRE